MERPSYQAILQLYASQRLVRLVRPDAPGAHFVVADDHSRAPYKTRPSSPVLGSIPSRVLFPNVGPSPSTADPRSSATAPEVPLDNGASTVFVNPVATVCDTSGDTSDTPDTPPHPGHSFLDDFVPRAISGSDWLAGSSAVINSTTSALNTTTTALNSTAAAVRQMFASSSDRLVGARPTSGADDTPRPRTNRDAPPPAPPAPPPPPTPQQFAELQLRYAALQRRVDELASRQNTEQRARAIEDDIEQRRKAAYEAANIPYSPRHDRPRSPSGSPFSLAPRHTEYRVAHKSIGYLRPADASNRPFEAVDGEVYVRSLAWLAHLRTRLELKDDFHYKN